MSRVGSFICRVVTAAITLGGTASASLAVVMNPALEPIVVLSGQPGPQGTFHWWAMSGYVDSWYAVPANVEVGNQSISNVKSVLESASWLNTSLTFVDGGKCWTNGVLCGGHLKWGVYLGEPANVFAVHFDNKFLALLYEDPISLFLIAGLPNAVSNIYAFATVDDVPAVPLPAALPLFGSVLAGAYLFSRWRRRGAGNLENSVPSVGPL